MKPYQQYKDAELCNVSNWPKLVELKRDAASYRSYNSFCGESRLKLTNGASLTSIKTMKFTVDYSARRKRTYFDLTSRYNLVYKDKDYSFTEVKNLISEGKQQIVIQQSSEKVIECELMEDRWYDSFIPVVIKSNHERFIRGTRFDYGFMLCSI